VGRKKAVSYGTTAINIPAFTGNSYQYDPSKKKLTYVLELTTPLFSNEKHSNNQCGLRTYYCATRSFRT
jgi:hypothetical protein